METKFNLESKTKYYIKFYSYKCGKNVQMKLHGLEYWHYDIDLANQNRISTAGEVQNPDFGYGGDNIRGYARLLWLKPYDTPEFPLRAATLFDYEDCKGHSIALFEDAKEKVKTYDNARLYYYRNEQVKTVSVMVPDGLRVTINRWNYSTKKYEKTFENDGTKDRNCITLLDTGSNSDYWEVLVTRID